jgi:hypothetical protein
MWTCGLHQGKAQTESIRVFMTRNILDSLQEETLKGMSRFLSLS